MAISVEGWESGAEGKFPEFARLRTESWESDRSISALSFTGHLTLGKSLHLSECQVPSSTKKGNVPHLKGYCENLVNEKKANSESLELREGHDRGRAQIRAARDKFNLVLSIPAQHFHMCALSGTPIDPVGQEFIPSCYR